MKFKDIISSLPKLHCKCAPNWRIRSLIAREDAHERERASQNSPKMFSLEEIQLNFCLAKLMFWNNKDEPNGNFGFPRFATCAKCMKLYAWQRSRLLLQRWWRKGKQSIWVFKVACKRAFRFYLGLFFPGLKYATSTMAYDFFSFETNQ